MDELIWNPLWSGASLGRHVGAGNLGRVTKVDSVYQPGAAATKTPALRAWRRAVAS